MFYIFNLMLLLLYSYYTKIKHNDIQFMWVSGIHCFVLLGLRKYTVGTDSYNYLTLYKLISDGQITPLHTKAPLWTWLLQGISKLFSNFDQIYFLFTAFLIITLVWLAIYLLKIPCRQAVFVYFCIFQLLSFNANRTFLAIALVFFAYALALNDKKVLSVTVVVAAVFVHYTAVVGFFPILCALIDLGNKVRKELLVVAISLGTVTYQYLFGLFLKFFPIYSDTIENVKDTVGASAHLFQLLVFMMFLYSVYTLKKDKTKKFLILNERINLTNTVVITFAELVLYLIGGNTWFIQRTLLYLQIFCIIPFSICSNYKSKYRQLSYSCFYLMIAFLYFYRVFRNLGDVSPYLFYWQ